jgi:hypothetical protein
MRKRLYDFSIGTAIIILIAYVVLFVIGIFFLLDNDNLTFSNYIFVGLLSVSFIFLIVYYLILSIIVSEAGVKHRNKQIAKKDVEVFVRPNYRLKYNEIIFRDNKKNYESMTKKERKQSEIAIQHFPKYETYILNYLNIKELEFWGINSD